MKTIHSTVRSKAHYFIRSIAGAALLGLLLFWKWENAFGQTSGASLLSLDPQKAITQYAHDVWNRDQGLPQSAIQTLAQTPDGYLWIGLEEGLARFDGVQFTLYSKANTAAIIYNNIQALAVGKDSSLWIGTNGGGVIRFNDGQFTAYTTKDGLANDIVKAVYADRQDNLWIGSNGGLNRLHNGKWTLYTINDGLVNNVVQALYEDRQGRLWIGTDGGGLNCLANGKFFSYTTDEGLSNNEVTVIYEDQTNNLWVGTNNGLNRFANGKFDHYTTAEGLGSNFIRAIYEDGAGSLWIGTYGGGLNRFYNGKFETFSTQDGLSNDFVRALYEDREGSLWIGTYGGGLNRLRNGKFTTYSKRHGLSNDMVWSIYEDRAGTLWIGTDRGLNRFKDGKFTILNMKEVPLHVVVALHEDRAGNLWIGTEGGALLRYKNGTFVLYTIKDGLASNFVRAIIEDKKGHLWIGTDRGLNLFQNGKFKTYTTKDGLSNDEVRYLFEDRAGGLWIGTRTGGLTRLHNGHFTSYTTREGLSSDLIRPIYEDAAGAIWIGTNGGGLNRFKDGKFTQYTMKEGLFDDVIFQILDDTLGYFWMTCNNGIFRVSQQELNDFAAGKRQAITSVAYGKADGMGTNECNGGSQPAGWRTRDGRLWFPTIKGVAMIDPVHLVNNPLPPPVCVEKVIVDYHSLPAQANLQLAPGSRNLEIHYTGLSLVAPQKVLFKYKLDGLDPEWVEVGSRRVAYFTNVPPGEYKFCLIACNNDGVWNGKGAEFAFALQPHFYQTAWFYFLGFWALVLTGAGAYRYHIRQIRLREEDAALRRANEALESRVKERTAELEQSQNFLNSIIECLPLMLFIKDAKELRFVRFNRAGEEMVGLTQNQMLGKNDHDFFPKEQADFFTSKDRAALNSGNTIDIVEEPIQTPRGTRRLYTRKVPIFGANGRPQYLLGLSEDITERKATEAALRKSEERFRQLTENVREVFWMTDIAKNEMIYVSPIYEEIWGRSRTSLYESPRHWLTAIHPEDLQRVYESMLTKQTAGKYDEIYRIQRPDGSFRWIRDRAFPIRDHEGNVYRLVGIAEDITTLKQAESDIRRLKEGLEKRVLERTAELRGANAALQREVAERQRAQEQLQESESRFRQLAENISQVLWMESLDRRQLLYVSPVYEKIWGRSIASLREQPNTFLESVHDDDRERFKAHLSQQRQGQFSEIEYRIQRPDGEIHWIRDRSFPIRDASGNAYRSAGISEDITEHKRTEKQLRQYTEGLEKLVETRAARIQELERQRAESDKLAAAGRMAARIAHEINNPLAGIQSSFQLLKGALSTTHRYYHYAGIIESEIERIANIIRQMYDLYRPEKESVRPFRPDQTIRDVVALLKVGSHDRGVNIESDANGAADTVTLSEGMLRQVLYNLIQNALEASPAGSVVRISAVTAPGHLKIVVTDQGHGIPAELRSQIFEPFFTTKSVDNRTGGLGLGLSVTKSIVDAMGGTIAFESRVGEGTVFNIELPV